MKLSKLIEMLDAKAEQSPEVDPEVGIFENGGPRIYFRDMPEERDYVYVGEFTLERDEPPKERLRDLIEQDRSAYKYWAKCQCGAEMGVNMLGMGTCPECGTYRNPMKT